MQEASSPPEAAPEPLFTLDLGGNGGLLAPLDHEALIHWIQVEVERWTWLLQNSYGNHDSWQRDGVGKLHDAMSAAREAQQSLASNRDHSLQRLAFARERVNHVFSARYLPHSSTPLAKRVDAYRKEAGDMAASYFLAITAGGNGPLQLQPSHLDGWRGVAEGLQERFRIAAAAAKGRKAAAEQSLEALRVKAEDLVSQKGLAIDALHRDYEALAASVRSASEEQTDNFAQAQAERSQAFDKLRADHAQAMDALRRTFREELALRAPAQYWADKQKSHRMWAGVAGLFSFGGIVCAACGLGWLIHTLLQSNVAGTTPEAWKMAVIALLGVFAVWALRLVVRMFLSNMHLMTDASERVVMVKTYLALLEGDKLGGQDDRKLILQALFRPAADGIVKDEAVPFSVAEILTRSGKQ